jgi:hypothetical protein
MSVPRREVVLGGQVLGKRGQDHVPALITGRGWLVREQRGLGVTGLPCASVSMTSWACQQVTGLPASCREQRCRRTRCGVAGFWRIAATVPETHADPTGLRVPARVSRGQAQDIGLVERAADPCDAVPGEALGEHPRHAP